ncbi:uncharacterized protein DS421_17g596000 [Arachis hypogaea]|nr:uncharacterized protein DS421_17g596000 [Arachis hypogaea]
MKGEGKSRGRDLWRERQGAAAGGEEEKEMRRSRGYRRRTPCGRRCPTRHAAPPDCRAWRVVPSPPLSSRSWSHQSSLCHARRSATHRTELCCHVLLPSPQIHADVELRGKRRLRGGGGAMVVVFSATPTAIAVKNCRQSRHEGGQEAEGSWPPQVSLSEGEAAPLCFWPSGVVMWLPGSPPELRAELLPLEILLSSPEKFAVVVIRIYRRCRLRWLPGCRRTGLETAAVLVQPFFLSFELLWLLRKWLGAEVLVAVSSG